MKKRKFAAVALTAFCVFTCTMNTYAATKVKSVNISLKLEDFDSSGTPVVSAAAKSAKYYVNDLYAASSDESLDNIYIIELVAGDDFYFDVTKTDQIKVSGLGAEFQKASRQNNGQSLIITVALLGSYLGEIKEADWSDTGYIRWEQAENAVYYSLAVTDPNGNIKKVDTGGIKYDLRPFLQNQGRYSFQVRPVNKEGNGEWMEGGEFYVSEEMANTNQLLYAVKKRITYKNNIRSPDNQIVEYLNVGWQMAENGRYWYRNHDASYPQCMWLKTNDNWYFCDEDGYAVTDTYMNYDGNDYYMQSDGRLLVNGFAPDGRYASDNGTLKNK